ncbi:peptidyl-prolyl cis-trans isomerase [Xylophilus rhododendri]|uniref:Peptidyl-prolyl cis-trans isomerase n=1 Tax=Xylophilus rhododendri TaxID=2697032 RepID=A0A857J0G6_9BURK|nr:peptidylprolyl isomerase [Xylophilus rhododendri]QHI96763.1 peptidyl-prolyl cis-trans isomerase [Xylophilus rhododendri]
MLKTQTLSRRACGLLIGGLLAVGAAHAQAPAKVKLSTSQGDIVIELNAAKAPKTVANFLQYVGEHQYDGTVFHRVIDGFMIQGGGFGPDMREKTTRAPIAFETTGLTNDRGTIAMARTSNPNSATSQFFINVKDNAMLNPPGADGYGYVVFGKVVGGMDVVDKIRTVATGNKGPHQNVPIEPVVIRSATVLP